MLDIRMSQEVSQSHVSNPVPEMSLAIRALQKTARDIEAAAEADAATDLSGTIKAQAKLLVLWKLLH